MTDIIEDLRYLFLELDIKNTGLNRDSIDKFYTKINIVNKCIDDIKKYIKITDGDLIIEPSAGNGSFIENIKLLSKNYMFYDIAPENNQILKQDFLELNYSAFKNTFKDIHIIGNPPFGRQSSIAIKFIKKACEFSKTISFILPKSFKKNSLKRAFSLNYHLIYEIDLPDKSFTVDNKEHDVPCVFQIWERQNIQRNPVEKIEPIGFIFTNKNDNPDMSFRRVGSNAGKFDREILTKNIQSHYFIKIINNKTIDDVINALSLINFDFNNTVGPKSISKQELIEKINEVLN
jgi:predicted RNA methylase